MNNDIKVFDEYLQSLWNDFSLPQQLKDAMDYSLFAGGKRIRPLLCMAVSTMKDENDMKKCTPLAAAIEMVHTYSLIHDDLPAMDDDDLRRGKPTNHLVYGEGMSILAGDALLSHSFYVLQETEVTQDIMRKINKLFSKNIGIGGMVTGQVLDIQMENTQQPVTVDEITHVAIEKTGRLFELALVGTALVYDYSDEVVKALHIIGIEMGKLFQAVDDYLDQDETQGKTVGSDIKKNKPTMLSLLGKEKLRKYILNLQKEIEYQIILLEENKMNCNNLKNIILKITDKI